MKGRTFFPVLVAVSLLLVGPGLVWGQKSPYGVEEYNAYVDTNQSQDPNQRLQTIEAFLQSYPKSVLRAFVYPNYVKTAWALQRYATVMKAVDAFLALDRSEATNMYKQSKFTDAQIDGIYYEALVLHTYSFLQSLSQAGSGAEARASQATKYARRGLELHEQLYRRVQPPADAAQRGQFEKNKRQQEASFHSVLAFTAWRKKDYAAAEQEYGVLVNFTPQDAAINYRLGLSKLRNQPPEYLESFWYLSRAVALGVQKKDEVRRFLTTSIAAYQQVLPECIEGRVGQLIAGVADSVHPPQGWTLASAEDVNSVRAEMDVKRILDDLKEGGDTAELMWLASCGSEIGSGEDGQPQLAVLILDISETEDNLVTLRAAAGQQAADAKIANLEVKVAGPPEAKQLKVEDVVRISGTIGGYQNEPEFLLKLKGGKVNAEDIPETR